MNYYQYDLDYIVRDQVQTPLQKNEGRIGVIVEVLRYQKGQEEELSKIKICEAAGLGFFKVFKVWGL